MAILQQIALLFNKNVLLRRRHPGVLLLEVIWPILIVGIVALIRVAVPPQDSSTCHYQERAMPSAGLVPFLQSFVCNLDNKCHSEASRQTIMQSAASVSRLVGQLTPSLADNQVLEMLDSVDNGVTLIKTFTALSSDNSLIQYLNNATSLSKYLRDPELVKRVLVQDYNFSQEAADALMSSQANVSAILAMSGYPDLKGVACQPSSLSQYLVFPKGTNVTEVSRSLCDLNESKIADITNFLQRQLNVAEIVRLMSLFEELKERLQLPYSLKDGLKDVADMLDLLFSIQDLTSAVKELALIKGLPQILRNIPTWVQQIEESGSAIAPVKDLVTALDPMLIALLPANDTVWPGLRDGAQLTTRLLELVMSRQGPAGGTANATLARELMASVAAFLLDVDAAFQDLSPEVRQLLDALAGLDWTRLYDLALQTIRNNHTSLEAPLEQLQYFLEKTSVWPTIATVLPLVDDVLRTLGLTLHELAGMRGGLEALQSGSGAVGSLLDRVLDMGPNVTLAVLKAFISPDKLATILAQSNSEWSEICTDIINTIQNDIGAKTAKELGLMLCFGKVQDGLDTVLDELNINNITAAVNQTLERFMTLLNQGSVAVPVVNISFVDIWHKVQMLMESIGSLDNSTAESWMDVLVLKDTLWHRMQDHQRDWEPVLDILNEKYIFSSLLSLFRAAGLMMNDSHSAGWMRQNLGPYAHIVAVVVKSVFDEMESMKDMYTKDSPIGKLVYYGTNYAPDITVALLDIMHNGNIEVIYRLVSSGDPLKTFCNDHVMQQLGMPMVVVVNLEDAICDTNWTEVTNAMLNIPSTFSAMIEGVMSAFNTMQNGNSTYSLEDDWRNLTYYTSRIYDLVSTQTTAGSSANAGEAVLGGLVTQGPWNLALLANYTQVAAAMDVTVAKLNNMTSDDLYTFGNIVSRMLENIERLLQNNTEAMQQFHVLKLYSRIVDDISLIIIQYDKNNSSLLFGSINSLPDTVQYFPQEIRDMVVLAADAYPEFIDALKNIILHPSETIHRFVTEGFHAPDCVNTTVTGMLMLLPSSRFGQLESKICSTNWSQIPLQMGNNSLIMPISNAMLDIMLQLNKLNNNSAEISVNWTQGIHHAVTAVDILLKQMGYLEKTFTTLDLAPFNITAIQNKWQQFYMDMDQLKNIDMNRLMTAVAELQVLVENNLVAKIPDNSGILYMLNANLYISEQFLEFVIVQLRYLNSTRKVNIIEMLGSDELRKMFEVLRYSPEINQIGINTVARILDDPSQLMILDLTQLCSNLTLFEKAVAVDESVISTRLLQQTVCGLDLNVTKLFQELRLHWNGFDHLVNAFELIMQPNTTVHVNATQVVTLQNTFSMLLASIVNNGPVLVLFDDDRWMNASLYDVPWLKLLDRLKAMYEKFTGPNSTAAIEQLISASVLSTLNSIPGMDKPLLYLSAVLDLIDRQFERSLDSLPEAFRDYPNVRTMLSLLEDVPEIFEMFAYTVLQHQDKLAQWAPAMASWDTFCSHDPSDLVASPPGSRLTVGEVFQRLCSINITQIAMELNHYQGVDRLEAVLFGNTTETVNLTALSLSLGGVIRGLNSIVTYPTSSIYNLQLFNQTIWEGVFERLGQDLNGTAENFMSPEVIINFYNKLLGNYSELNETSNMVNKVFAVADIVLDQLLSSLNGKSLVEVFAQYPTIKSTVELLDKLPEIYETVMYTALFAPDKVIARGEAFSSLELFCTADPYSLFTVPVAVTFNLTAWQSQFCSLNLTRLTEELLGYGSNRDISNLFQANSSVPANLTMVVSKIEALVGRLTDKNGTASQSWMKFDARFLNTSLWEASNSNLARWLSNTSALFWTSTTAIDRLLSESVLSTLESIPGMDKPLLYLSAVLDLIDRQFELSLDSLPEAFRDYPNVRTMLSLLEDVPEIFEMFAYTVLQHPEKLARWAPAMASWDTFCSHDPNDLVASPPGSRLTVGGVFQRLCSINITHIAVELNHYKGLDKVETVLYGNSTERVNVTALSKHLRGFIHNINFLVTTPSGTGYNLRLFNQTVWEGIFERLGQNVNGTAENFLSPEVLMDFYNKLLGGYPEINQTSNMVDKVFAVADIVLDQMLRSLNGRSLEEMFAQYPTIKLAVGLLDKLPEIYETIMYTALYAPDKVTGRAEAFSSLESFCTSDMYSLFSIPAMVTFDLALWQSQFCSLNLTELMGEILHYGGSQDISSLFQTNASTSINLTSVIAKMETVARRLISSNATSDGWLNLSARFLNISLWEAATSHVVRWVSNTSSLFWMDPGLVMQLFGDLVHKYNISGELAFLNPVYSIIEVLADKLLIYENMTSLTIQQLFVRAPQIQNMVSLLEEPGVIEVLLQSVNSAKFQPLLSSGNLSAVFAMLCAPGADLATVLTVPAGVTIDLRKVQVQFCRLDPPVLEREVTDFFGIEQIVQALNSSHSVDFKALSQKYVRMANMIDRWIRTPPTFTLPSGWTNESFWLEMLEDYARTRQDPETIMQELRNLLEKIDTSVGDAGLEKVGLIAETVLRLINQNLLALQGQNLTLENAVQKIPVLKSVFDALGVNGEMLALLLQSPVKSLQLLVEAFLTQGTAAQATVCNMTRLQQVLQLPRTFSNTSLYGAVCLNDSSMAVNNIIKNLNLQQLLSELESNTTKPGNWTQILRQSEELTKLIQNIVAKPPTFNSSSLLATLERSFNTTDIWQIASLFDADALAALMQAFPQLDMMGGILRSSDIVVNFLEDMLKRLVATNGTMLDLKMLFSRSPSFVRLLDAALDTRPSLAEALSSVMMRPDKVNEFVALRPDKILTVLCSAEKLDYYFFRPPDVNITGLAAALCALNYTRFVEELSENFMLEALVQKITDAMNNTDPLNLQSYLHSYMDLVDLVKNLTAVNSVTFDGRDLANAFNVDVSRLLEAWKAYGQVLNRTYPASILASLETVLLALGNSTEGRAMLYALKVTEVYLHSFNKALKDIATHPISLASIVNNTEVGKVIAPFLKDPYKLEDIMALEILPQQFYSLFTSGVDPTKALCGPELLRAFAAPGNESAVLKQLQTNVCSTNATVLLWQTIMGQANGYQLYQQLQILWKEIAAGTANSSITSISDEVQQLITMVTHLIQEYQAGNRSAESLLDWRAFQDIFNRFSSSVGQRLINMSQQWSAELSGMLMNAVPDDSAGTKARLVNTMTIFMKIINDRMDDCLRTGVSLPSLLNHSDTLVRLMEAYLDVMRLSAQALVDDRFSLSRVLEVSMNSTLLEQYCRNKTLAAYLAQGQSVSNVTTALQTVICSITDMPDVFRELIDYKAIEQQLSTIWNLNLPIKGNYLEFAESAKRFNDLVVKLASTPLQVDPKLQSFDLRGLTSGLEKMFTDPRMIFRILELLGIAIDGPLQTSQLNDVWYGINAYVAQPLLSLVERLNAVNVSLARLIKDPSSLLSVLPTLVDLNLHFDVVESTFLQPLINRFWNNEDFRLTYLCNGSLPLDIFRSSGVEPDLVTILCPLRPSQWVMAMTSRNISKSQIVSWVTQIEEFYKTVKPRCSSAQLNDPALYHYCSMPKYGATEGTDLVDSQGMYWTRLMTTLEAVVDSLVPKDGQTVQDAGQALMSLWTSLQGAVINNTLQSAMMYIETLERSGDIGQGSEWMTFKQVMRFLQQAGDLLNSGLRNMTGTSGTLYLQSLLPDPQKLADLLQSVLEPTVVSELLAAAVNPQLFNQMVYPDKLLNITCDPALFTNMFSNFSVRANVTLIQTQLCNAVRSKSTLVQELIDLFHAGDVLVQLDRLVNGGSSGETGDTGLWQGLYQTVTEMLHHVDQLLHGDFNTTLTTAWLDPLMRFVHRLSQPSMNNIEGMCDNYLSVLGGTDSQPLAMLARLATLIGKALPVVSVLDDTVCSIVKDDGLDLAEGVAVLKQHGMIGLLQAISGFINETTGESTCQKLAATTAEIYSWSVNISQSQQPIDVDRLGQCLSRGGSLFANTLKGFSQLYHLLDDVTQLLTDDDLKLLMKNQEQLAPILDFVLSIFNNERHVVVRFEDLLANKTDVLSYLLGAAKLLPEAVSSFLNATLNLNSTTFLNHSVTEIAEILCDPVLLGHVITLPQLSPFSMSDIVGMLCTDNVNLTASVFKDASQSEAIISQLTELLLPVSDGLIVSNITSSIVELISSFQSISTLIDVMGQGFDAKFLMENADTIDAIMAGSGSLERIVNSLSSLVGTLKYVVRPQDEHIITDIQVFIRGLVGLDLVQSRLLTAIRVSDLVKDSAAVAKYLTDELGLSSEMASALLKSTYSIRVFLNVTELLTSEVPCEERLHQFLVLNSTNNLDDEITSKFCDFNQTEVTKFIEIMVPELNIGSLLQQYITSSGAAFLTKINMTRKEVEVMFDTLSDGGEVLSETYKILTNDNSTFKPLFADLSKNVEGEFSALVSLQPLLCGEGQVIISDEFNLDSKVSGAPSAKDAAELAQLKGDFCQDLYRQVKQDAMGSIIWSYLKPLMSGKILYTPNTTAASKIMKEANWMFDTLSRVKYVSKRWADKAPSLMTLSDEASELSKLESALDSGFVQGVLKATAGIDPQTITRGLQSLKSNQMNSSDIKTLQKVAQLVYNYTTCLELERFEPVATEEMMEKRARELYASGRFLGGIVFLNLDSGSRKKRQALTDNLPNHIMYKIRVDMDNVPTTSRIKDRLWMPTPQDDFANDMRYMRGFAQLQDMVEGALLRLKVNGSYSDAGVSLQQMPFPCHREDDYIHFLGSYLLPVLMTFAWLAAMGIATHNLVYDRQSGQEEALRIMGMVSGLNVVTWLLVTLLIMAFVSGIITIIFKYSGIFFYSNPFIFFLFLLCFCLSTTLMCYFISSLFTRVTLALLSVLIIYFISFLPFIILVSAETTMTMWQKTLACLSSTTAFSFGAMLITRFEEEAKGLQWSNINETVVSDSVSFAWTCYMMLIDSAIYLILGWYIRTVKPGKYGVSQPWYFPLSASYWCSCISSSPDRLPPVQSEHSSKLHQAATEGLDVGISVRGLRKKYRGRGDVVRGIDVNIYRDQVTTLLGHNGAGKTTTLNMMVGVLNPSGGLVVIEGKKSHGRTGILGLCPQHNTLFEYMTVWEHMEFYGGIKGRLSSKALLSEIRKLLQDVDLLHLKDVPAKNLSGGMQRRLCVALAFVGGSKTVLLDEPTSGVDPHARTNVWNLIIKNRPGRTILMSTHHMDEADTMSDRILIMHRGSLLSSGSPAFLKEQLGGGYRLTLNTAPTMHLADETPQATPEQMTATHTKVLTFIQGNMPGAAFVESVGTDLTVRLPPQDNSTSSLYDFFCHLDSQCTDLGVLGYGISNTTLEEVFLKLTSEENGTDMANGKSRSTTSSSETESDITSDERSSLHPVSSSSTRPQRTVTGVPLKLQQLGALLLKRVFHYSRNWRMAISTLILPLIAFLCAMGFTTLRPGQDSMPNLLISPALYTRVAAESYAFFQDNSGDQWADHFISTLKASKPGIGTTCMGDFDPGKDFVCVEPDLSMHQSQKKEQYCQCSSSSFQCWDGPNAEVVMQMKSRPRLTLQDLDKMDLDVYLVNSTYSYIDQRFGGWTLEPNITSGNSSQRQVKVWYNNKGYHAVSAYYNALTNNLLRSAVDPGLAHTYGVTLFNHPFMLSEKQISRKSIEAAATDVGIAMVILLALSFIPSAFMVYLTNERVSQERHLQAISGVGTGLYWLASFLWDLFVYCLGLTIMVIIIVIFKNGGFYDRENLGGFALLVFLYGWAVIPAMYCTLRLFRSGSSAYLTLFCINMLIGLLTTIILFIISLLHSTSAINRTAEVLKYVFLIFPQYCLGMGLVDLVTNQFQYELLQRFGEDTYDSPFSMEMLGWKFVALAVEGVIFMLVNLFVQSRKEGSVSMSSSMRYSSTKEDDDVFREQDRIRSGAAAGDALIVTDLCKVYRRGGKKFCAVDHLSFGIEQGECFGLLGVNGAGKTTTFKMLTGALIPSHGDALIANKSLGSLRDKLGTEMGYCPQEDALDLYLSGRQTLRFHARLRGFRSRQVEALVEEQLRRLQLGALADRPVYTYSGGNRRKLALAVAMMGDPPLLLLDEPTTGMDPATRRLAWKCITMATQRGQSVLLTSHSMDECDVLCSRLAIMVNGRLQCLGSPQHLKDKFGDGYTVVLHMIGLSHNRHTVAESFMSQFRGAVIKDTNHSVVQVNIPRGSGTVADIFAALQRVQLQHRISYYSVTQTTLDTVFVNFAREQMDEAEREADVETGSISSETSLSQDTAAPFRKSLPDIPYAYLNHGYNRSGSMFSLHQQASGFGKTPSSGFDNPASNQTAFVTRL